MATRRKSKRSQAAHKGWETRRAREAAEAEAKRIAAEKRKHAREKREREAAREARELARKKKSKAPKRKPQKPKTPQRKPQKPKTPRKPPKRKYPSWIERINKKRPKLIPWIEKTKRVHEQRERWDLFNRAFDALAEGYRAMQKLHEEFPQYTLQELYSIGYGSP